MFQFSRQFRLLDGLEHGLKNRLFQFGLSLVNLTRPIPVEQYFKLFANFTTVQFCTKFGSLASLDVLGLEFPEVSKLQFNELVRLDFGQVSFADFGLNGLELFSEKPDSSFLEQKELLL